MSGFLGKEPESYVWRVGYGYAAAIREGAEEIPVIFFRSFSNTSGVAIDIYKCSW